MKIGLVACSDGQKQKHRKDIEQLVGLLKELKVDSVLSDYIYEKSNGLSGTGKERAEAFNGMYRNREIEGVFDISGGNLANDVLDFIDYDLVQRSDKRFHGYSDLTTVINALYTMSHKSSVLYFIRNLIYEDRNNQVEYFRKSILGNEDDLYRIHVNFIRGNSMKGVVLGGNIRCLLKLAGTRYWPDFKDKLLFIEAYAGEAPQLITYFNQLKQIGVFRQVKGVIVGEFTKMQEGKILPRAEEILLDYIPESLPVCKTFDIGHSSSSKAIIIGEYREFHSDCSL